MKTLHLHIGSYKTGTTSIQNTLFKNKKILKHLGFAYPGRQANHHLSYFATKASEEDWPRQFKSIEKEKLKRATNNYFTNLELDLENNTEEQIVSTEYLYIENEVYIDNYLSYFRDFFSEIKVYLFIRNPVEYYRSTQQQFIKARSYITPPQLSHQEFKAVIESWQKFCDISVIEYVQEQDSCELLCKKIGIKYDQLEKPETKSNTSLSIEQMLLLEKIQYHLYQKYEDRFKNHLGVIQQVNVPFSSKPQLQEWVKSVIFKNHYEDLEWLKEEHDINFLKRYTENKDIPTIPEFENDRARVRDVYKLEEEQTVERYESLVIDSLLKKLVQEAS